MDFIKSNKLIIIFLFTLIIFILFLINKDKRFVQPGAVKTINNRATAELNVENIDENKEDSIYVKGGNFKDYYIGDSTIIFYREFGMGYNAEELDSKEAPTLFESIGGSRYLYISELETDTKEKYYLLTIHYYDHGGLASEYALVYSPDQDKILYETNQRVKDGWSNGISKIDGDGIRISYLHTHLKFGMSSKLEYYQFYKIDTENGVVASANTDHKDVFQKLLDNLKNECITEITSELYDDNVKQTFEEVKDEYGEDFICKLPNEGSRPSYKPNLMDGETIITPKIYFLYRKALEDIINGKEVDMTVLDY